MQLFPVVVRSRKLGDVFGFPKEQRKKPSINMHLKGFQVVLVMVENLPASIGDVRDTGSIPGSGSPGEGNGNPLQHFCLGNPWTDEPGGLQSMGVTKSQTRLKQLT